jgi:transporter family protein
MRYLLWAVLALGAYTLVAPLVSVAMVEMPSDVVLVIANGILVLAAGVLIVTSGVEVTQWLDHPRAPYAYAGGLFLAVGIIAYYRALAMGPVSVVVPVFGMFIVTSSVVGVVFLDETMTLRKGLGLAFAVAAVYLTAVE